MTNIDYHQREKQYFIYFQLTLYLIYIDEGFGIYSTYKNLISGIYKLQRNV